MCRKTARRRRRRARSAGARLFGDPRAARGGASRARVRARPAAAISRGRPGCASRAVISSSPHRRRRLERAARYAGPRPSVRAVGVENGHPSPVGRHAPVPSGELSSITARVAPPSRCRAASTISSGLQSLYVGSRVVAWRRRLSSPQWMSYKERPVSGSTMPALMGARPVPGRAYRRQPPYSRTPTSVAQLALDSRASATGHRRRSRRRSSIVETARSRAHQAQGGAEGGVANSCACRPRAEDGTAAVAGAGITTVDALKAAAEAGQLKGHAGIGVNEQKIVNLAAGAHQFPNRALLGTTLPKLRGRGAARAGVGGGRPRLGAPDARRKHLDIIATHTILRCSITSAASWGRGRRRKGSDKGRWFPATPATTAGRRRSYGNLLQRRFEGPTASRCARMRRAPRPVRLRVLRDGSRAAKSKLQTEEEVYRYPSATTGSRRSCARTGEPPRRSELPVLVSCATCAATCTRTRPGRTGRTRSRTWPPRRSRAATRTTRSATTRSGCAVICCSARRTRSTR